jgi:hypothetical protein
MRSIFDQYESPENRLTHALGCCLERDPRLLRAFIRWATNKKGIVSGRLRILEQQIPGAPLSLMDEEESSGLPDLWIHDGAQWSLIVESKIAASVSTTQLQRHLNTARRNGFTDVTLLVLAPAIPAHGVSGVVYRTWPQVYCWLRRHVKTTEWAACLTDYMEVAEARMTTDGYLGSKPLTEFDGIPFGPDHPYTYREAKRVLRLALDELRKRSGLRELGMDPSGRRRSAITGREGVSVWDFLPLKEASEANFTTCPHLDLSIQAQRTIVVITLPNAVPSLMRRNLVHLGQDGFAELISTVGARVSKAIRGVSRAYPFMEVLQRHYPSQRAHPVTDALLEFDLRTIGGCQRGSVKRQPQWLQAAYSAISKKRSNLQVGIGAVLPYGDSILQSCRVLDVIARVWIGCKPWLAAVLKKR